jgi:hypothetical protein
VVLFHPLGTELSPTAVRHRGVGLILAREEASGEGAVGDHADAFLVAEGEEVSFYLAI